MYKIRKFGLTAAVKTFQTTEWMLDGLIFTRPYIPFALLSLIGGFAIGFFLAR
ncbi:MAG: hypothetical protein ACK2UB_09980 [Anaerolineales bacterium]|jgi:hypothetical protein